MALGNGGGLGGRALILVIGVIGVAVYWFSNQSINPYSGKKELNTISIEKEMQLGAQSYVQLLQQERGGVLCETTRCTREADATVDLVRDIGARLVAAAAEYEAEMLERYDFTPVVERFDWTFNVVNSDQPNAFCLPGGYVAVYTRMMDITGDFDGRFEAADDLDDFGDQSRLAAVVGHEIGHALAHHGAKRMSQQRLAQIGSMAVGVGLGDMDAGQRMAVMQAFGMAVQGRLLAFSREHETEADEIGLELLTRACFDPRAAPELWTRMAELSAGRTPPEWASTHPSSTTRAENFERLMPQYVAKFEERCGGGAAERARRGGF